MIELLTSLAHNVILGSLGYISLGASTALYFWSKINP